MKPSCQYIPLQKPRLILRLGGLGNRNFGRESETRIGENPLVLKSSVRKACEGIRRAIDVALVDIHSRDLKRAETDPARGCGSDSWLQKLRNYVSGADCWNSLEFSDSGVFSSDKPEVQLLIGGAKGADRIIAGVAQGDSVPGVDWKLVRVEPKSPLDVPWEEGIGVGKPSPRRTKVIEKLSSDEEIDRTEATALTTSIRKRAYAYRAQSEALRHHSDLLLAVWDPDAGGKAGGTVESVESALRERIPVIAVLVRGGAEARIVLLRNLDHFKALNGLSNIQPRDDWGEGT